VSDRFDKCRSCTHDWIPIGSGGFYGQQCTRCGLGYIDNVRELAPPSSGYPVSGMPEADKPHCETNPNLTPIRA